MLVVLARRRFLLSQLHPLLSGAAKLEASRLVATWSPADLTLPSRRTMLRLEPLSLNLSHGALLDGLAQFLGQKAMLKSAELAARTTAVQLVVDDEAGTSETRRFDALVGPAKAVAAAASSSGSAAGSGALHVACWGTVDRSSEQLNMTLGVPADSLALLGVHGLPDGFVLQLKVTGTPDAPGVDWRDASDKLLALAALKVAEALPPARAAEDSGRSVRERIGRHWLQSARTYAVGMGRSLLEQQQQVPPPPEDAPSWARPNWQ